MINRAANLAAIDLIATVLGDLNEKAVYVGGAVIGFYADPDAEDSRATKDVDLFLEITTPLELEEIRQKLNQRGFKQTAEDNVLCRFNYGEIKVDVMSTVAIGWAPANLWFEKGLKHTLTINLNSARQIQLLELPFFLATKFAAFAGRGKDPRTSHDMEDIIYVLDSNSHWNAEITNAPADVKEYLKEQLAQVKFETILAHLFENDRAKLVVERIESLGV